MQPTNQQVLEEVQDVKDLLRRYIDESQDWRGDSMVWRQRIELELSQNTEVTTEIREASTAIGWIKKSVIWIGSFAVGIAGVIGLLQLIGGQNGG
jgi:hypothetical protein